VTFLPLLLLSATLRPASFAAASSTCASAAELLLEAECALFSASFVTAAAGGCDMLSWCGGGRMSVLMDGADGSSWLAARGELKADRSAG
jgi:streptogramin lyase